MPGLRDDRLRPPGVKPELLLDGARGRGVLRLHRRLLAKAVAAKAIPGFWVDGQVALDSESSALVVAWVVDHVNGRGRRLFATDSSRVSCRDKASLCPRTKHQTRRNSP